MRASVAFDTLQVVGISVPGTPGPALLGTAEPSLLVAVSTGDGTPVAGLQREAFSIAALVARRAGTSPVSLVPATVGEPMEGVYALHFATGTIGRLAATRLPCVVDVRAEGNQGAGRGRTLVQLGT